MPHDGTNTFQNSCLQQIDEENFRIGQDCAVKKHSKSVMDCSFVHYAAKISLSSTVG